MKRKCVVLSILLSLFFCLSTQPSNAPVPSSGPFYSRLIKIGHCGPDIKPTRPYDKNPYCLFECEVYNTTKRSNLVRGNFTVLKRPDMKDLIRFRGYQWRDGKWQMKYNFNNIACNGVLRTYLMNMVNMNFEKSSCNYPKGTFTFKDVDYNQLEHLIWSKNREYGRLRWVAELFARTGTQFCFAYEVLIEPA